MAITGLSNHRMTFDIGSVIYTHISVPAFRKGAVAEGNTDAATITVAVLIGASGTSAANAPLLKQGNLRYGSPCPALSDLF